MGTSMSSMIKSLLKSETIIEFDSLPEAKQQEFERLSGLMDNMATDEDAATLFDSLEASPEFARVVDRDGFTLLHVACRSNLCNLEMIQVLVKLFPEALQCKDKETHMIPLHFACTNNAISLEVVHFLVENYPEALQVTGGLYHRLPLHAICSNETSCSLDIMRFMVERYPEALGVSGSSGDLPLHYACAHESSLEVIRCLLDQYPNALKQTTNSGMLPLHCCICGFQRRQFTDYSSLVDRMRVLLAGYPEALDMPYFHDDEVHGDWSLWPTSKERDVFKEIAGLLVKEPALRDQLEWASQMVETLSKVDTGGVVHIVGLRTTDLREACRDRLVEIERHVAVLENLLEPFRFD